MDTVPVWVNLLNPARRLTNSADCNQHRTRLCANGRFWRKAALCHKSERGLMAKAVASRKCDTCGRRGFDGCLGVRLTPDIRLGTTDDL
jgi:hypothetical protein